jgi:hypothetical protein
MRIFLRQKLGYTCLPAVLSLLLAVEKRPKLYYLSPVARLILFSIVCALSGDAYVGLLLTHARVFRPYVLFSSILFVERAVSTDPKEREEGGLAQVTTVWTTSIYTL